MNVNLEIAKREYLIEKKITDISTIKLITLVFIGIDKNNEAIFEVYRLATTIPETWVLHKYDVTNLSIYSFPKNVAVTPISVANFINSKTSLGLRFDDIEYIHEKDTSTFMVMMSTDSMYFSNYFILKVV